METKIDGEAMSLGDILMLLLRNWYWYALSLIVCLGIAVFQIKKSPLIYERHATVLIKSQGAISQMQDETALFRDLDMTTDGGFLVDNEIQIFKARRLMEEVVRRLNLDIDYNIKGRFRDWTCYSSTPVKLSFPDADENSRLSLIMTVEDVGKVKLHGFSDGSDASFIASPGDTVTTPVGRIILTDNLRTRSNNSIGEDIRVTKSSVSSVASSLSGRLHSDLLSKTSTIIKLSISDVSSQRAEDVLNTLVRVYDEDAINDKNRVAINTEKFIAEQLEILESELNDIDLVIANYKSTNKLTDLNSDASAFRATVTTIEQELADLQNRHSVAEYILKYIQSREGNGEARFDVIPNNAGLGSQSLETMISEYNTQTLLREKLKLDAGERNPQVVDLTNSVDQMRSRIIVSIRNYLESLDIEIASVKKRVGSSTYRLSVMPAQQKTVTGVERQQSTKEQLYMYLLNKRQENALTASIAESNARILDPAMGSGTPIEPKKSFIMMSGLFAGLLIPTVFLFLLMVADNKVRNKKDLFKIASVPVVGEIPQKKGTRWTVRKAKEHGHKHNSLQSNVGNRIVFSGKAHDAVTESIRILRTNIHFLGGSQGKHQVIMFTSFLPGAGKTFVGINLGMSLAASGAKVLMVDLDLRRGSLSAELNKGKVGMTDYLGGFCTNIDDVIIKTPYHDNLDMIPVGHKAPNPAELLMDNSLDCMMEVLKKRYDYIVIDCVPANVVADAMISNRIADMTLFVVRAGNLDKRLLPEIQNIYDSGKLHNMALVLNGISDSHVYGSGYGYGYGYGYYGYSTYYENGSK